MRLLVVALLTAGCASLERDPPSPYAFLVYDPAGGDIPLPNDLVHDGDHLDLPIDDDLSPTEAAFRTYLNTLDAWSTVTPVAFSLSAPADPATVTADTLQVWEWGADPAPVPDLAIEVDGTDLTVVPPRDGWRRAGDYVVMVRGVHTTDGLPVGPDAAFWYLRLDEPLDDPAHQRAFPGDTRAERMDAAATLEQLRQDLAPAFDHFEALGVPRDEVAALWRFSVTRRVELEMDADSQRMPIPFDLLLDPDTGLVDLAANPWDDPLEADAKEQLAKLDGFALAGDLLFELTGAVDPDTVTADNVRLWHVGQTPRELPVIVHPYADEGPCQDAAGCRHVAVEVHPDHRPLAPGATYALVVTDGLRDPHGAPVVPMPVGWFVSADLPIAVDGASTIASLPDEDAARLEGVRREVDGLLDDIGRDGIVAAWPFTTLDPAEDIAAVASSAERLSLTVEPRVTAREPAWALIGGHALDSLFPGWANPGPELYALRTSGVDHVVHGTLDLPQFLDPETRRWGDEYHLDEVRFLATVPQGLDPDVPVPVVMFGHAIVTDRRFLLTVSGALAQRGFAAVAIDFPFHGDRTACVDASLAAVPNFLPPALQDLTGQDDLLLYLPPCVSGDDATCSPTGECLDADGNPEPFNAFPIMDIRPASGAAFLDLDDLPGVPDHFRQAVADLGGLHHSLRSSPDWEGVFGAPVGDVHYVGMSLGGILGATYVAVTPDIERAVLNVPGADMVRLFQDSTYFGPQIDAFYADNDIAAGSWDQRRLSTVATWLIDAVDPHSVAHLYAEDDRAVLIQMDKVNGSIGDIVIPNHTTETLQRVGDLAMDTYPSVLHGDLVIPVIGDGMLDDAADWLEGP